MYKKKIFILKNIIENFTINITKHAEKITTIYYGPLAHTRTSRTCTETLFIRFSNKSPSVFETRRWLNTTEKKYGSSVKIVAFIHAIAARHTIFMYNIIENWGKNYRNSIERRQLMQLMNHIHDLSEFTGRNTLPFGETEKEPTILTFAAFPFLSWNYSISLSCLETIYCSKCLRRRFFFVYSSLCVSIREHTR